MKMTKRHWLIPLFAIQLTGTGYTIGQQFSTQLQGQSYLFQTKPIDPRDPFRGQYVALGFDVEKTYPFAGCNEKIGVTENDKLYAVLKKDTQSIAQITAITTSKPTQPNYLSITSYWCNQADGLEISLPFNRYYANENEAYDLEQRARENPEGAFLKVSVYKGNYSVEELLFSER